MEYGKIVMLNTQLWLETLEAVSLTTFNTFSDLAVICCDLAYRVMTILFLCTDNFLTAEACF